MSQPQNYKNHGRVDPIFHYVIVPILILNIFVSIYWFSRHYATHRHSGFWIILLSVMLLLAANLTRSYALKAQNRIIRLEERLRLASLVSPSELVELDSLNMRQYIALRFASNPELPDLARRAIREKLTAKQIKEAIVVWRPDYDRI